MYFTNVCQRNLECDLEVIYFGRDRHLVYDVIEAVSGYFRSVLPRFRYIKAFML